SGAFAEAGNGLLEMRDIFVDAQGTQVFDRVCPDLAILGGLISGRPQLTSHLKFPSMLRHLRRQHFEEGMSIRDPRPALEGVCSFGVVLELHVIDESQVVVKMPVVGIILNAVFHQLDGALGLAGSVWWSGSEKTAAELVSHQKMGIEVGGDFKKRGQQVVALSVIVMPPPEVLHGARPVEAGHQAVVTEAGALDDLR